MAQLKNRTIQFSGSDLSGSNGAKNRTYTLPHNNVSTTGMTIIVNQAVLMDSDYNQSDNIITFLNNMYDFMELTIHYLQEIPGTTTSSDSGYASNLELSRFMSLVDTVPNHETGSKYEEVGTGDNSETVFWLDKKGVISGTYNIYYGASTASVTELTESTHYSLDLETSKLTLTAAGVTAVGTNKIYADYYYNYQEFTDQQVTDAITRAEQVVDHITNNHFCDGTDTTPNWSQHTDEYHDGRGCFERDYFLKHYPIADLSTTVNGAITADDATITVTSTQGFPSSGYILIEDDKIAYTGKTATTFTGCTSVSAHDDGTTVKGYVVESSTTESGGEISWDVLEEGTEFELDRSTGRLHIYAGGTYQYGRYYSDLNSPPDQVPHRVRVNYSSGTSSIPDDVKKATLMIASQDLMKAVVRKAHAQGLNNYNPSLIEVDQAELDKLIAHYRNDMSARI